MLELIEDYGIIYKSPQDDFTQEFEDDLQELFSYGRQVKETNTDWH